MQTYSVKVEYVREGTTKVFTGSFMGLNTGHALEVAKTFVRTYLKPECINLAVITQSIDY